MRVRTQQCPCLKITAGCTAAKFPILFFAAMEQGKNSHVLLAKRKSWHEQSLSTSLQIRNGSSVRTAWFQVNFIFKYLKMYNRRILTAFTCHDAAVSRDGRQEFSCRRVCQKQGKELLFQSYQHQQQHFSWPSSRNDFYLDGVLNVKWQRRQWELRHFGNL